MTDSSFPTFEAWVKLFFDHPEFKGTEPQWYEDDPSSYEDGPKEIRIEYLSRLFKDAENLLQQYTDKQIKGSMNLLIEYHCNYLLWDESIDWSKRQICIQSIYDFYKGVLAKRCPILLSERYALDDICYGWWENFPTQYIKSDLLIKELMQLFEKILTMPNESCQHSALHALGHFQTEIKGHNT
jgi:hypothetical protein